MKYLYNVKKIIKSNTILIYFFNNFLFHNKLHFQKQKVRGLEHSVLKHSKIVINGKNNTVELGANSYFDHCSIIIYGFNCQIKIGDNCILNNAIFHLEDTKSKIIIGNNTSLTGIIELGSVEGKTISIGSNCIFSSKIHIVNSDSHSILDFDGNRINKAEDVIIGNKVWVGYGATILKGTQIRDTTIVGANSLVNKKFDKTNVIIAGNPAKIIKENISWIYDR